MLSVSLNPYPQASAWVHICLRVSTQQYSQSNTVLIIFVPLFIVLETETNKASKFRTVSYLNFEYGFSEKKFRFLTVYNQKFNSQNYADLTITAGSKVNQFKNSEPIIPIINTIATLFFKDNYMKLYETNFASVRYFQNIANGVNWNINLEYANRKKLFNNTDYSFFKKSDVYSSNNPTNEIDFVNAGFENHNLFKFATEFKINFGNTEQKQNLFHTISYNYL